MDPVRDHAHGAPFHLAGAYAPLLEERTLFDLDVVGEIPHDLRGTYVRNGPNPRSGTSPAWFAGEGMLHGVRLEGGRARWYRNRWMRGGRLPNTNVVDHAGRILALVETRLPVEVDRELGTVGAYDFGGGLTRSMSAHPKTCPTTGELVFISYGHALPHLTVYRADRTGRIVHTAPITVPAATYMHDIAITERAVVFWDLPVLVDDWWSPRPLRWADDHRARIGVLPREGQDGDVSWFDVNPCSISHAMNAFEDGDRVILDAVRGPHIEKAHALVRFVLDRRTGRVQEHTVDARFVDFPRVHPAVVGRPHRYGYATELLDWATGGFQRTVARKYDMEAGVCQLHDFGPSGMPGECVIAPREGAKSEDDAWAIVLVYDARRDASDLVILDAARFDEDPVATIRIPHRVPVGIHGSWIADQDCRPGPDGG
jgi:carotenoid cleavage dioxygenase